MSEKKDNNIDEEIISDSNESPIDDIELEDLESQKGDKMKVLREKLKTCEHEKSEHLDALQRAKADFLNSKKRNEEQLQREIGRASSTFMEKLLPLCDSFDIAMSSTEATEQAEGEWKKGIDAIYAQLGSILKSYNIEKVGVVGEMFDPNIHEAVSVDEESDSETDTITTVLQYGYKREEELIRPAKVILSN